MAGQGLDPSRRPARMVPVVLPLFFGTAHARRGRAPDRPLARVPASRGPGAQSLRARRPVLSAKAASGAAAVGLRQPDPLADDPSQAGIAPITLSYRAPEPYGNPPVLTRTACAALRCEDRSAESDKFNLPPRRVVRLRGCVRASLSRCRAAAPGRERETAAARARGARPAVPSQL